MPDLELQATGSPNADVTVALAHGAGAGMDTPFMQTIADGLASEGLYVVRFEFSYMRRTREDGKRRPPDRQPALLECWREVIQQFDPSCLFIGGKSMGGRMASLIADECSVAGLVCLGYPFHPPGKPDRLRVDHLRELKTPTLILQGERDTFGSRTEVEQYSLSDSIQLHWLADGDHSFKPRKASGHSEAANLKVAINETRQFIRQVIA